MVYKMTTIVLLGLPILSLAASQIKFLDQYGGDWLYVAENGMSTGDEKDLISHKNGGYHVASYGIEKDFTEVLVVRTESRWCDDLSTNRAVWGKSLKTDASMGVQADSGTWYATAPATGSVPGQWQQFPVSLMPRDTDRGYKNRNSNCKNCWTKGKAAPKNVTLESLKSDGSVAKITFPTKKSMLRVANIKAFLNLAPGCRVNGETQWRVYVRGGNTPKAKSSDAICNMPIRLDSGTRNTETNGGGAGHASYTSPNKWYLHSNRRTYSNGKFYWLSNLIDGSSSCNPQKTCSKRDRSTTELAHNCYYYPNSGGGTSLKIKLPEKRYIKYVDVDVLSRGDTFTYDFKVKADGKDYTPQNNRARVLSHLRFYSIGNYRWPGRWSQNGLTGFDGCGKMLRYEIDAEVYEVEIYITSASHPLLNEIVLYGTNAESKECADAKIQEVADKAIAERKALLALISNSTRKSTEQINILVNASKETNQRIIQLETMVSLLNSSFDQVLTKKLAKFESEIADMSNTITDQASTIKAHGINQQAQGIQVDRIKAALKQGVLGGAAVNMNSIVANDVIRPKTCNNKLDDPTCADYSSADCTDSVVGPGARVQCKVLCNTCTVTEEPRILTDEGNIKFMVPQDKDIYMNSDRIMTATTIRSLLQSGIRAAFNVSLVDDL